MRKIRWQSVTSLVLIGIFVLAALAAPWLSPSAEAGSAQPYKRVGIISDRVPHPPNAQAILGTVPTQLDVFHTLVWGARYELLFGLSVTLVSACLGTLLGALSGYLGGALNRISMRITDGFLTFPVIAAVVFIGMIYGILSSRVTVLAQAPPVGAVAQAVQVEQGNMLFDSLTGWASNLFLLVKPFPLAIILFSWMPYTRMINGQVVNLKQAEFVKAAEATGVRKLRIVWKHLLPNAIAPNIVLATRDIGGLVILRATFTYIGLTDGSPWATILVAGRNYVIGPGGNPGHYWWVYLPITLAIMLFGLAWNLFGDEVNRWLNPRER